MAHAFEYQREHSGVEIGFFVQQSKLFYDRLVSGLALRGWFPSSWHTPTVNRNPQPDASRSKGRGFFLFDRFTPANLSARQPEQNTIHERHSIKVPKV